MRPENRLDAGTPTRTETALGGTEVSSGPARTQGRLGLGDHRLLLLDGDDRDAHRVAMALQRQTAFSYVLDRAWPLGQGLDACRRAPYDVVLLGLEPEAARFLESVQAVSAAAPAAAVIVLAPPGRLDLAERAMRCGAQDYLITSHVTPHELCRSIRYALRRKQDLDALTQVRDEFISLVSHEIRTPLAAAVAALEMLLDEDGGALEPAAARLAGIASTNVVILRTMVADLLDATSLHSGRLALARRPTDPGELVTQVLTTLSSLAERGGLELRQEIAAGEPIEVDAERVTQVLSKLVVNGIRYTPPGGVVAISCRPGAEGDVLFVVRDSGTGIPPENLPHLFERLYQVPKDEAAASRRGLGLGLYLCREIVTAHGGDIWVVSTPGRGSTFSFRLPARAPSTGGTSSSPSGS